MLPHTRGLPGNQSASKVSTSKPIHDFDKYPTKNHYMKRFIILFYGVICYLIFGITTFYMIGFLGNFLVPKSVDAPRDLQHSKPFIVNLVLMLIFAIQHSVMARPWFKHRWIQWIPPSAERSTYVLLSSLALGLLFWKWQPLRGILWEIQDPWGHAVIYALYGLGWAQVLVTTFLIHHFDLFGLRQVSANFRGKVPHPIPFQEPYLYKLTRHPLYFGWLIVFWAAPTMTSTRLVLALATTAYIVIAIQLEERDLLKNHQEYADYRRRVPMLIPLPRGPWIKR